MKQLPKFKTDEEAAIWFDAHDTADFMDSMEAVTDQFSVARTPFPTKPIDVRLRADYLEAIQEVAEREGIPYQMLIQNWLLEKLVQEAPELLVTGS
jgi:predicted DNA binding CopG/RHH family protein